MVGGGRAGRRLRPGRGLAGGWRGGAAGPAASGSESGERAGLSQGHVCSDPHGEKARDGAAGGRDSLPLGGALRGNAGGRAADLFGAREGGDQGFGWCEDTAAPASSRATGGRGGQAGSKGLECQEEGWQGELVRGRTGCGSLCWGRMTGRRPRGPGGEGGGTEASVRSQPAAPAADPAGAGIPAHSPQSRGFRPSGPPRAHFGRREPRIPSCSRRVGSGSGKNHPRLLGLILKVK